MTTEPAAAGQRRPAAAPDHTLASFVTEVLADPSTHDRPALRRLRRENVTRPTFLIGAGTCGLGAGARDTRDAIYAFLYTHHLEADVVEVGCVGLCSAEPLVDIQLPGRTRLSFGPVRPGDVAELVDAVLWGTVPTDARLLGQHTQPGLIPWDGVPRLADHPFFAAQTRWVLESCGLSDPERLDEYLARGGYRALAKALREHTPEGVCDMVLRAGLRGRGGGGFPTGRKWELARAAEGTQKYLICNADEGDPGAFMDRAVIEGDPHRLVEGMIIAAYAIGATKAYVYIRAEYPLAITRLKKALAQAEAAGILGDDVLGSGVSLHIAIKQGAGAFVCGEETALIHSIMGRRGMPRPRPPFPVTSGLFDKPTVINNVETLANLPTLVGRGPEAFAAVGTEGSAGTKVFALSGDVVRTGLVEVAMGTSVRDIVFTVGGGVPHGKGFKAAQMGGPSGGCIPAQHLDIAVDYASLQEVGAMMGSGGLVVMDEDTCMVDVARFFMDFIQRESCGKCIPCREGTRRMLEILDRITQSRRDETGSDALKRFRRVMYLERLAEVIKETSLCGLGQSAPNPVLSALRWFRDEYEVHVFERRCPAHVCKELLTYTIDPERCRGCGLCAKECPTGAIIGERKKPYTIRVDMCIGCGNCLTACRLDAVQAA
ncbi:MAG: NADH-quinone oxidoreductase subunit F [Deltaproteobacteria bacterium HGW-Deltaproteobacteria-14]|jgi:NADH:ubiquinone oxidoreductase subunit F (NADH-binding)/ferredoxin|nr:MAG: NADH-quinone oxidoreductase subunit F [Deltaproteobacteria bacterium HGW-Deltaproteobacteria-14]